MEVDESLNLVSIRCCLKNLLKMCSSSHQFSKLKLTIIVIAKFQYACLEFVQVICSVRTELVNKV